MLKHSRQGSPESRKRRRRRRRKIFEILRNKTPRFQIEIICQIVARLCTIIPQT